MLLQLFTTLLVFFLVFPIWIKLMFLFSIQLIKNENTLLFEKTKLVYFLWLLHVASPVSEWVRGNLVRYLAVGSRMIGGYATNFWVGSHDAFIPAAGLENIQLVHVLHTHVWIRRSNSNKRREKRKRRVNERTKKEGSRSQLPSLLSTIADLC